MILGRSGEAKISNPETGIVMMTANVPYGAKWVAKPNGKVKKGDGKDVHHRDRNTSNNDVSNLGVTSMTYNRGKNK